MIESEDATVAALFPTLFLAALVEASKFLRMPKGVSRMPLAKSIVLSYHKIDCNNKDDHDEPASVSPAALLGPLDLDALHCRLVQVVLCCLQSIDTVFASFCCHFGISMDRSIPSQERLTMSLLVYSPAALRAPGSGCLVLRQL